MSALTRRPTHCPFCREGGMGLGLLHAARLRYPFLLLLQLWLELIVEFLPPHPHLHIRGYRSPTAMIRGLNRERHAPLQSNC